MITESDRDYVFVMVLPYHWKKQNSCRRRSCRRKRRVHWHWQATQRRIDRMLRELYEKPIVDMLNAPNALLAAIFPDEQEAA